MRPRVLGDLVRLRRANTGSNSNLSVSKFTYFDLNSAFEQNRVTEMSPFPVLIGVRKFFTLGEVEMCKFRRCDSDLAARFEPCLGCGCPLWLGDEAWELTDDDYGLFCSVRCGVLYDRVNRLYESLGATGIVLDPLDPAEAKA